MNVHAKPDWIGTPRRYEEKGETAIAIDFSLEQDDSRYKLMLQIKQTGEKQYTCKRYGIKPGAMKPHPIDIPVTVDMLPLFEHILNDPYVQAFL